MTEMITIIAVGVGLAGLILNGHKNIREQIDQRLDLIGQRLDLMDGRLGQMDVRFDQVDARFEKLEVRFEKLEMRMGTMERQLTKIVGAVPPCPPVWKGCWKDCAKRYLAGHPPVVKSQG